MLFNMLNVMYQTFLLLSFSLVSHVQILFDDVDGGRLAVSCLNVTNVQACPLINEKAVTVKLISQVIGFCFFFFLNLHLPAAASISMCILHLLMATTMTDKNNTHKIKLESNDNEKKRNESLSKNSS